MEMAEPGKADAADARRLVSALPAGIEDQRPARIRHKRHSWLKRLRIGWAVRRATQGEVDPAFDTFRAGVSGELPQPETGGIILAACNEYYYWHYARSLVASMEQTGERQRVHLHLCEPGTAALENIRELAALLSAVTLTWTVDDCRLARNLTHKTIYYAASRFLLAPLILERTNVPVLVIDVDGVVVRPARQAFERLLQDADIVVIERGEEAKPTMKVLASAFGFNPTAEGKRFARQLARALASVFTLKPRYHVDQITIHYLLERAKRSRSLRIGAMPKRFWDHDFGPDSVIWTAKGWSRKDSDTFRQAKQAAEDFVAALPTPERWSV